jgi:uncharacterized membrane protein
MIEFENRVEIDRPVDVVFQFLADLENLPKWNYYVTRVVKTSDGPPGVGSTYHQQRKTDDQEIEIAALEQDRMLILRTIPPSTPELERTMILERDEDRTQILDRWKLDTGHLGILQMLAKGRVRSAVEENLGKLKELLEQGSVTLQDGRQVLLEGKET